MRKQSGEWAIVDAAQVAMDKRYATAGTLDGIKRELRAIALDPARNAVCVALVKVIPVTLTAQNVMRLKVTFGAPAAQGGAK